MGNCNTCVTTSPLCCDRPMGDADLQKPDSRAADKERELFHRKKRNLLSDLSNNDVLTNENRADFYAFNLDKLPL